MRTLAALFAIVLLSLSVAACGDSAGGTGHASSSNTKTGDTSANPMPQGGARPSSRKRDLDGDTDNNDDDSKIVGYGHAANASDRQALTALIKHYYKAAVTESGATGCSMLYPFIAEAVVENYGRAPALRGTTCAMVIAKLFAYRHRVLVDEAATLKVFAVRVEGDKALVVLSFARRPIRQIAARRDGNIWKLLELEDGLIE